MQAFGGGGFLGLGNTLRSLTMAPAQAALHEAHRMARRRLEDGGVASSEPKRVKANAAPTDFILPPDIAAEEVVKAIETQLRERGSPMDSRSGAPPVLARRAGGRVAVSGYHLLRLGDGRFDRGRRFMERVIKDIRDRRVLTRSVQERSR
jgi:hypothetical protein